jgi:hypothetical protein
MELQTPSKFKAIFRVCSLLIFLGVFSIFFVGYADYQLHEENKIVEAFLLGAGDLQPNFEKSLTMYTENTQASMDYLSMHRPEDETGYIQFISTLEILGQSQGINLTLQILDGDVVTKDETGSHYIDYKVQFYARQDQVTAFLEAVEELAYFTRVMGLHYQSFEYFDLGKDSDTPNVILTLRLYVK